MNAKLQTMLEETLMKNSQLQKVALLFFISFIWQCIVDLVDQIIESSEGGKGAAGKGRPKPAPAASAAHHGDDDDDVQTTM